MRDLGTDTAAPAVTVGAALRPHLFRWLGGAGGWAPGRLCMTGAPVELGFTSVGGPLRLTIEPGDPGAGLSARVARCGAMIGALGLRPALPLARLARLQDGAPLRYGAWLGLRDGPEAKLYAEIPEGRDPALILPDALRPLLSVGRPTMLGLDGQTTELYLTCRDLLLSALPRLLAPAGQAARAEEAAALLFDLAGQMPRAQLPVRDIGVSYKCGAGGIGAVTLYATALALFGDDARASAQLAATATALGGDLSAATRFAQGLRPLDPGMLHHGMVGLTFVPGRAPVLSCGLAAPAEALA